MKSHTIQNWLSGDKLRSAWFKKQYKLIALIIVLIITYMLAGYHAAEQQHQLSDLRKEVRDKRLEYLTISTELVRTTRQSSVAKELDKRGSKLKENTTPVVQIE